MRKIGDICKYKDPTMPDYSWFVVDEVPYYGPCFRGPHIKQNQHVDYKWNLQDTPLVPEDEVPDEIWASLAAWRLTDG